MRRDGLGDSGSCACAYPPSVPLSAGFAGWRPPGGSVSSDLLTAAFSEGHHRWTRASFVRNEF